MRGLGYLLVALALGLAPARAAPLSIVAAENFYGDIASQIGDDTVAVTSILANPEQDPHLFELSASTARAVARAEIVIFNGAGYDPWMTKLLAASPARGRTVIEVAALAGRKPGDNPHLWYDPATMPALAQALAAALEARDPAHRADCAARLARFEASLQPIATKIAALRQVWRGTKVTATEPVFGYMAAAIGLAMRNEGFQRAVMNDTEPSVAEIAGFERDLRTRAVRLLIYNVQTSQALTERMRALARQSGVPVVGVSETEPGGKHYQDWILSELDAVERALAGGPP